MAKQTTTNAYTPSNDSDELNPEFLFSLTPNELLCAIVNGQLDPVEYAKKQLANRGFNAQNKWVGFKQADRDLGLK